MNLDWPLNFHHLQAIAVLVGCASKYMAFHWQWGNLSFDSFLENDKTKKEFIGKNGVNRTKAKLIPSSYLSVGRWLISVQIQLIQLALHITTCMQLTLIEILSLTPKAMGCLRLVYHGGVDSTPPLRSQPLWHLWT